MDETYIKIKGEKACLYRAVDSEGNTLDFYLSNKRDVKAVKIFLKEVFDFCHVTKPRVITVEGDKACPVAIRELKMKKVHHMVCHSG